MSEIDRVLSNGKWEFNKEVTDCFENMLERSIPQYDVMRKLVVDVAGNIVLNKCENFNLLDLGCSNGLNIRDFVVKYKNKGNYFGVDCSEAMLEDFTKRFALWDNVKSQFMDLRKDFPEGNYDLITSILCLCFIPIQYRQSILINAYNHLNPGGALIVVEKVLGSSLPIDSAMVDIYYDMKRDHGYTDEQIERKKLSLEGVQVPLMSNWNMEFLKLAGFNQVDVFWRWMNFVGYVAIK